MISIVVDDRLKISKIFDILCLHHVPVPPMTRFAGWRLRGHDGNSCDVNQTMMRSFGQPMTAFGPIHDVGQKSESNARDIRTSEKKY